MAYNLNKSPQPFGGRGKQQPSDGSHPVPAASPFRPASASPLPTAPRMTAESQHAPSPSHVMLRRQLLSPGASSPQSSPCPSPVAGRLRPHSIALADGNSPQSLGMHHPIVPVCSFLYYYMIYEWLGRRGVFQWLPSSCTRGHCNLLSRTPVYFWNNVDTSAVFTNRSQRALSLEKQFINFNGCQRDIFPWLVRKKTRHSKSNNLK